MNEFSTLWTKDAPPARDRAFELAVMARIERRAFHFALLRNAVLALGAAIVLALLGPFVELVWRESFAPFASGMVIAALLLAATILAQQYYFQPD